MEKKINEVCETTSRMLSNMPHDMFPLVRVRFSLNEQS